MWVPYSVAGDFNIRLDRPDDCHARQLLQEFSAHGLQCRVSSTTDERGGILDVVAIRNDAAAPAVSVVDVGISNHRLLWWTSQLERPPPIYHTTTYRRWRHLNLDEFKAALHESALCVNTPTTNPDDDNVDMLAEQYTSVITAIADRMAPLETVTCRRRMSDPWFDDEYRAARKNCRWLERRSRRS